VPGLDLLAEDDAHAGGGIFLLYEGIDGGVEGFEEFGAEGAHVVEVEFEGVFGFGVGGGGQQLAGEFGWEGHGCLLREVGEELCRGSVVIDCRSSPYCRTLTTLAWMSQFGEMVKLLSVLHHRRLGSIDNSKS
jgi:hypothetical protein